MDFLTDTMGPMGPLFAVGLLGALLIALSLPIMLSKKKDPLDKLNAKKKEKKVVAADAAPSLRYESKTEKLDKYSEFLEPQDKETFGTVQKKMIEAGYRDPTAVRTFYFAQFALALGFLFLGIMYTLMLSPDDTPIQTTLLTILGPAGAGYYLPTYWIERRRQTRHELLQEGFPDALDLMLVCVEAGQSLDQSIQRVATEIKPAFPDLSEEFEIVANEMKAGKDRVEVLRSFGDRAGSQDISSFVTVMIQSATFGTSISEALRVYGAEMRDKRVMRAEEKANKLPTKLTLGTMMFTLPPLLVILIGPSVYDIYALLLEGK